MSMELGHARLCLNVENLQASLDFYRALGFETLEEYPEDGWAVIYRRTFVISLYQGHIERNIVTFRGADIESLANELQAAGITLTKPARGEEDGSWSTEIRDPDGNVIYFNTFPGEHPDEL